MALNNKTCSPCCAVTGSNTPLSTKYDCNLPGLETLCLGAERQNKLPQLALKHWTEPSWAEEFNLPEDRVFSEAANILEILFWI
jgi:hypothetical protein